MQQKKQRKNKVLLAVPTAGTIHWKLVPHLVKMCQDTRYDVELFISKMVGNEANRNHIKDKFLKEQYDYLLMIDTDQEPVGNPLDMIKHDKDVVSMPTVINMGRNMFWNIFDENKDEDCAESPIIYRTKRGEGLEKVYATGTGCVLIKRKVLEEMETPFSPYRDEDDMRLITQDVAFSIRCYEMGFEIWADWDRPLHHYKEVNLLNVGM